MARTRKLTIEIAGVEKGMSRAVDSTDRKLGTLGERAGKIGKKVAIGLAAGVTGLAVLGAGAVNAGSDLNESLSKAQAVFKSQSAAIETFADNAAKNIGLSKQAALEATSSFGNMFVQLGIGESQASGLSQGMVNLAADFASFHNADITQVLEAQQAAFRGEYDALQRFVPTINAAAVEQEALRQTGKKTTKELTAQEKALATQALMMKGAGDAVGDFQRTSDGLANRQRVLKAQFQDVQAEVGQKLIPVVMKLADVFLNTVLPAVGAVGRFIADHKTEFMFLAAIIGGPLVLALGAWAASAIAAGAATLAAMAPVLAIGAAIGALVAGVIYAYKNWDWFRAAVQKVAAFLTGTLWPALQKVAGFITGTVIPTIGRVIGVFGSWLGKAREVTSGIADKFRSLVSFITGMPGKIGRAASGMFDGITNAFKSAINWVIRGWNSLEFKIPGFDPPGPGPKFGGFTLGVPDIPQLAGGGIVKASPGGILANIGEGRYDEAVIPLDGRHGLAAPIQPVPVVIELDGQVLGRAMIRFDADYRSQNGRPAFGG